MPTERVVAVSGPLTPPPPARMPTEVVTAPGLEAAREGAKVPLEPPEEESVDVALTLSSPSLMMLSRPFPPAMPVDWVDAVSEPLVPPVPPKVNDELSRERLAVEGTSIAAPFQTWSSPAPAPMPAASVNAPDAAPAPEEPNTTVEEPKGAG